METKTESISWHEAGHIAMALIIGRRFKYATIKTTGNLLGHVEPEDAEINGLWELVGALQVILAGSIAQAHIEKKVFTIDSLAASDRKQITRLLVDNKNIISQAEAADFMAWIFTRTTEHLKKRLPELKRIARALEVEQTLTYNRCRELMQNQVLN